MVSVVTIVRNEVMGIESTIQSVLKQTYQPIEYLLIDGGSTDGTLEIILRYDRQISRVESEPDRGISDALNKGSRLATGDLLIFLNAGDSFVDEQALAQAIDLIPPDAPIRQTIFYGNARYVCASGSSLIEADHRHLSQRNSICHQGVLIGADAQRANPYDERLTIFMDYDVWLRCTGRYSFVKLPTVISNFTAGGVSGADASGVRYRIERSVVQLLNRQTAPTLSAITRTLLIVAGFEFKRRLRHVMGVRGFAFFKKCVGRRTPSSWAPPTQSLKTKLE